MLRLDPGAEEPAPAGGRGSARCASTLALGAWPVLSLVWPVLVVTLLIGRGHDWGSRVTDVSFIVFPAFAALTTCRTATVRVGRERLGWLLLAGAWAIYGCAGLLRTVQGLQGAHPSPSPADAGFVLFSVPALAGLLLLPAPGREMCSRLRTLADGAVVGVGFIFLSWFFVLGAVFHSRTAGWARVTSLGYPLADLVTLAFVLTLALRAAPSGRRMWLVLAGGFASLALIDSVYAREELAGTDRSSGHANALCALYALAFCLFALAPQLAGTRERRLTRLAAWQESLPYLLLSACAVVAAFTPSFAHRPILLVTFMLLLLATGARQLLIIAEKIRLADDLEARVTLRTAELHVEREFLQAVVDNLHDGVVACDAAGRLSFFNEATGQFHHAELLPILPGQWAMAYGLLSPDTLQPLDEHDVPLMRALRGEVVANQEIVIQDRDGCQTYVSCSGRALIGADGTVAGAVVAMHNITEQRQARLALERRALRDELTGLGNRALFNDHLSAVMRRPAAGPDCAAVLLLDVDDFKNVNDSLGHAAGDELLVEVARRITGMLRPGDTAARIGGDEFALLRDDSTESDAVSVADRLLTALAVPFRVHSAEVTVGASIGVAVTDDRGEPRDLLAAADLAMYQAKQRRKGGVVVFDPRMRLAALDRVSMESDLRRAVRNQELHLVYEPMVDLQTGDLAGVEALVRWQHPDRGAVPPAEFIPLAEQTGLILEVGAWVLRAAASQLARWTAQFPGTQLCVSVNVSVRQLERNGLLGVLDEVLAAGLHPTQLIMEITETALSLDDKAATETLQAIKDRGVCLAVDDFGTGYSNLGRLRSVPVSRLKIDQSFTAEITHAGSVAPIVDATLAMARGLGLGVVAEGIETLVQLQYLRRLGCAQAQGHLLSRPLASLGIEQILAGARPWEGLFDDRTGPWDGGEAADLTRLIDLAVDGEVGIGHLIHPLLEKLQQITGLPPMYLTRLSQDGVSQRVMYAGLGAIVAEGDLLHGDGSWSRDAAPSGLRRDAVLANEGADAGTETEPGIIGYLIEPVHGQNGQVYGALGCAARTAVQLTEAHRATARLFAVLVTEKLCAMAVARGVGAPEQRATSDVDLRRTPLRVISE